MALTGKTVVITGATGGIGFATATHYLNGGIKNLALLDVREDAEKLAQLQSKFSEANIIFLVTDITKRDVLEQTFKSVLEKFQKIDVVLNSAGVLREKDLELVVATNLIGLINASLVAMDAMSKANGGNGGVILNVSSVAGLTATPGTPIYNATKHGAIGFTRSMAHDCYFSKHGVKFITICPGLTETPMASGFEKNLLFPEARGAMHEILTSIPLQPADVCGKIISEITTTAENGSVWIVDGGKFEEVTIPKFWRL